MAREITNNYEVGGHLEGNSWKSNLAVFHRDSNNLTDWTYSSETLPYAARSAENVDVDLIGLESVTAYKHDYFDFTGSYTYLTKSGDYENPAVDASFYALNYAKHRFTTSLVLHVTSELDLRSDTEFRFQAPNSLRDSDDQSYVISSLALNYSPDFAKGLEFSFLADNIGKENFEEVPGVPGAGRAMVFLVGYRY